MPKFEEGNLYIRVALPDSISPAVAVAAAGRMRRIAHGGEAEGGRRPEVRLTQSQLGRQGDGIDPDGFYQDRYLRRPRA